MCRCHNCHSVFFKTLDVRILKNKTQKSAPPDLLYKKRCKRCKFKYFFLKSLPSGRTEPATFELWSQGEPIKESVSVRPKILVSEYTQRVSQPADTLIPYLQGGSA